MVDTEEPASPKPGEHNEYQAFYFILLVTFGMTSATMFYYTQVMMNMFKGYKDVNQVEDFWTVCLSVCLIWDSYPQNPLES